MFGPTEIFTIFFITLGPLKILQPFVQRTSGISEATAHRVAWWTFVVASAAIVGGSLVARQMLDSWQVSIPALRLTGGIVFFLVAIKQLLEQYEPAQQSAPEPLPAAPLAAAARLVFPMVLTPYGIAAVITLLASGSETVPSATVLSLVLVVMVLDLAAMWFARRILVGPMILFLQVIGAILAVLQVALSVQIILEALRVLGVLTDGQRIG